MWAKDEIKIKLAINHNFSVLTLWGSVMNKTSDEGILELISSFLGDINEIEKD